MSTWMIVLASLLLIAIALPALVLGVAPLRRRLVVRPAFDAFRTRMPSISATERAALEAGTVWWEGELFAGDPDWKRLHDVPLPTLSGSERRFIEDKVPALCALVDDWEVTAERHDLPPQAWEYIKREGFLGMIVPKRYGGLEFSAYAHSEVVSRLSTRSSALAVSVMVPNSLGPAELLLHYGTEAQKDYYLPRLARGDEIPAFALTSPWAGSDAASIPDHGVVCWGEWQGERVLGMKVSWDKRYITLAPVCTLLGLAFQLHDPQRLLGEQENLGITCALVPRDHPGVELGRRHRPLDAMFMNGPTRGTDVFMPLDFIIGGAPMAGQGWRMLMECLAAGRAISLPSANAAMAQFTARTVGAYARIRSQFRTPIGRFEGVEEALARIAGLTYTADAARSMTAGAIDLGERPAVVSAIVKYHVTELTRQVVNDGMDVIGGKGICLGPSNFLGRAYQQLPIGITVEGANILTRSLIIFGQGAIRCHPHILDEMKAAEDEDRNRGYAAFEVAFERHLKLILANLARSLGRGLSGARLVRVRADVASEMLPYYRQLSRFSSAFSLLADASMISLGAALKRRERLSSRLGDALSQLYLASCVLKRFEDQGRNAEDAPLAHWALQDALYKLERALDEALANFPNRTLAALLRPLVLPLGRRRRLPSDALSHRAAALLLAPGDGRDRLTACCHLPNDEHQAVGALEQALAAALAAEPVEAKLRELERRGVLAGHPRANVRDLPGLAFELGHLDASEHAQLLRRDELRDRVIRVDDFAFDLAPERHAEPAPASTATALADDA